MLIKQKLPFIKIPTASLEDSREHIPTFRPTFIHAMTRHSPLFFGTDDEQNQYVQFHPLDVKTSVDRGGETWPASASRQECETDRFPTMIAYTVGTNRSLPIVCNMSALQASKEWEVTIALYSFHKTTFGFKSRFKIQIESSKSLFPFIQFSQPKIEISATHQTHLSTVAEGSHGRRSS
jgi:hypothetical protein